MADFMHKNKRGVGSYTDVDAGETVISANDTAPLPLSSTARHTEIASPLSRSLRTLVTATVPGEAAEVRREATFTVSPQMSNW